ncbi:Uncharacterised protein [Mycobacteroides abscessus subsp. abscessus]|nr:Uncharacterised protein [Mycobacteroides abscessus subsp. abscessus]
MQRAICSTIRSASATLVLILGGFVPSGTYTVRMGGNRSAPNIRTGIRRTLCGS